MTGRIDIGIGARPAVTSADALSVAEREKLGRVADLLIPASTDMPSGSQAGVQDAQIDRVFSVRPDLVEVVRTGLAAIDEPLPADFAQLDARRIPGLRGLADAVTAAYFLDPVVAERVGYRTRSAIPIRFDDDLASLVAPVVGRGSIYRPTP